MVCAGDSITHGVMSANYVKQLQDRWQFDDRRVINAGISGDLAYNLEKRLGEIVACQPDAVTVFVGTNDVAAQIDDKWRDGYMKSRGLPHYPTLEWYRDTLTRIIRRLKSETSARIALIDLPPLGENLDSSINNRVNIYNAALRTVSINEFLNKVGHDARCPFVEVHVVRQYD